MLGDSITPIVTARNRETLEQVLILIEQWLSSRGLEISTEKTNVVCMEDGFIVGVRYETTNHLQFFVVLLHLSNREQMLCEAGWEE